MFLLAFLIIFLAVVVLWAAAVVVALVVAAGFALAGLWLLVDHLLHWRSRHGADAAGTAGGL